MIKVRVLGSSDVREVTLEEARDILEKASNDPQGGLIADGKTGEVIWQIGPDIEEIVIIEQMIGGG
jgi:hypothetical protein